MKKGWIVKKRIGIGVVNTQVIKRITMGVIAMFADRNPFFGKVYRLALKIWNSTMGFLCWVRYGPGTILIQNNHLEAHATLNTYKVNVLLTLTGGKSIFRWHISDESKSINFNYEVNYERIENCKWFPLKMLTKPFFTRKLIPDELAIMISECPSETLKQDFKNLLKKITDGNGRIIADEESE